MGSEWSGARGCQTGRARDGPFSILLTAQPVTAACVLCLSSELASASQPALLLAGGGGHTGTLGKKHSETNITETNIKRSLQI